MNLHVISRGNRLASLGQAITVDVDPVAGVIELTAPFYRRSIKLQDVAQVSSCEDDGHNRGLLNWFVVGKPSDPQGVRLNTGGRARADLVTRAGDRYGIVVDNLAQADAIVTAVSTNTRTA